MFYDEDARVVSGALHTKVLHADVPPLGEVDVTGFLTADFVADANGKYDFIITDNGGNTTTLHAQVGNVDTTRPTVDFHFEPLDGGDRTSIMEYGKTEYYNYDLREASLAA